MLDLLLHKNDFWRRDVANGEPSIFQAASLAVYFTEVHHSAIKDRVFQQLKLQSGNEPTLELLAIDHKVKSADVHLPTNGDFERSVFEILQNLFKTRFKLYFVQDEILCSRTYGPRSTLIYRLVRTSDYIYAALFPKNLKPLAQFCHKIVHLIIQSVSDNSQCLNSKAENGELQGKALENSTNFTRVSDKQNASVGSKCYSSLEMNKSYSLQFSDQNSLESNSYSYSAKDLSSLFAKRRQELKRVHVQLPPSQTATTGKFDILQNTLNQNESDRCENLIDQSIKAQNRFAEEIAQCTNQPVQDIAFFDMSRVFWHVKDESDNPFKNSTMEDKFSVIRNNETPFNHSRTMGEKKLQDSKRNIIHRKSEISKHNPIPSPHRVTHSSNDLQPIDCPENGQSIPPHLIHLPSETSGPKDPLDLSNCRANELKPTSFDHSNEQHNLSAPAQSLSQLLNRPFVEDEESDENVLEGSGFNLLDFLEAQPQCVQSPDSSEHPFTNTCNSGSSKYLHEGRIFQGRISRLPRDESLGSIEVFNSEIPSVRFHRNDLRQLELEHEGPIASTGLKEKVLQFKIAIVDVAPRYRAVGLRPSPSLN
jgi:hypothetical protein